VNSNNNRNYQPYSQIESLSPNLDNKGSYLNDINDQNRNEYKRVFINMIKFIISKLKFKIPKKQTIQLLNYFII